MSVTTPSLAHRPRGYVGRDHETIGSDILAVHNAVIAPARTLGPETLQRLAQVKPDGWYPIGWLLQLMDELHGKIGDAGLRKLGRELFKLSHADAVRANVRSASDLLHGFDGIYRRANRGVQIGGWVVEVFRPGYAELVKTTPHRCVMEEGILKEALFTIGTPAFIEQAECIHRGADACRFVLRSTVVDNRWTGTTS